MSYHEQLEPRNDFNLALESNVHPIDWKNPVPSGRYNLVVIGNNTMTPKIEVIIRFLHKWSCG